MQDTSSIAGRRGGSLAGPRLAGPRAPIRLGIVASGPLDPWDVTVFPRLSREGVTATILGAPGEENPVPIVEVETFRDISPWRRIGALERIGFKVHGFAQDRRLRFPPSPFTFDDAIVGFADLASDFDVLLAFETYRASTCQACMCHPAVVVKVTQNIAHNPPQALYGRLKQIVRRRSARFACVTESARSALLQEGFPEARITVIPEPVDTNAFRPTEGPPEPDGPLRIGFAGRVDISHGFLDLLLAFVGLLRETDARLKVAGDSPSLSEMHAIVARRGLADRVRYLGKLRHHQMPGFMAGIDVLCVPCREVPGWKPQFGIVNIEAMACGKPIVATDIGATPEIVPPGLRPFLVPPSDVRALEGALRTLALDRGLRARLGAEAREWVVRRFDLDRITEQWASLFANVSQEAGP